MAEPFEERSFAFMVEKVSDYAIFLLDTAGVIRTWNPAAHCMKGYTGEEAIGQYYGILYTEEDRRRHNPEQNLAHAAENGTFQEQTWRQRKDGSLMWAMVEIIALRDESGELTGFCKLTRDISDLKRVQDDLREADRRKDVFLAMLAHELRNPLAPVSAAAELLALGKMDPGSATTASQIIIRQVKHMSELVDDLLDVSRVSRGEIVLDMASLDMKLVVGLAIEQVRPLLETRQHTLLTRLAPAAAHVRGDKKRLVQVIANLLNNAAKYTPPGGTVSVDLAVTESGVCIAIADNGLGIDPAIQGTIFEMFVQAQRTSDRGSGGLGIGLALVRSLTHLHGGGVTCHSEGLGHGSRFTVCLPAMAADDPVPERRRAERLAELPTASTHLSVLVVDDNVDAAEMLQFFFTMSGHQVRVAHTAAAALAAVEASIPDVCILDIGLPDSDGHALAATIRSRSSPPPVLVALTGFGTARDRDQAAEAGFDRYFVKPVDLSALAEVLAGVAPRPA